jgi:hypothetical protein
MAKEKAESAAGEAPVKVSADTHVCLDGLYVEHADAVNRPRRLNIGGVNYEHTHDDESGVWCYRAM